MVDFQQAWTRPRLFPHNKWMIEYLRQAMAIIPAERVFRHFHALAFMRICKNIMGKLIAFRAALVAQMIHKFKESRIFIIYHDTNDLRYHIP
jgi:hypothetical protein